MNKVTQDIMDRYGLPEMYALEVQKIMETSGLDFSECTKAEYECTMGAAYQQAIGKYIREKQCCVCGGTARGKQRHNRDHGFGICPLCAKQEIVRHSVEEMISMYGYLGVNYFVRGLEKAINEVYGKSHGISLCANPDTEGE